MLTMVERFSGPALEILAAAEDAAGQIPPLWRLDATVAVNPYLGQAGETLEVTAARLARVGGVRSIPERAHFRDKWASGDLTRDDLALALADLPDAAPSVEALVEAMQRDAPAPVAIPTVARLAQDASGIAWPDLVAERIGHWAAGHYDAGQALWPAPQERAWLSWRAFAQRDLTPELFGLSGFAARVAATPMSARAALTACAEEMALDAKAAPTYFHALLMRLGGWAQLASGEAFRAAQKGEDCRDVTDLLTARLVFEAALLARYRDRIGARWSEIQEAHKAPVAPSQDDLVDAALQAAAEHAQARALDQRLSEAAPVPGGRPEVQAAFCIDVRSEVLRRALEAVDPQIETIGFAGFFGLAAAHRGHASDLVEARAPVLLVPGVDTTESDPQRSDALTRVARRATRAWGRFRLAAVSSFAFVEATGPLYLGKILRDALGLKPRHATAPATPVLDAGIPLDQRIDMAASILSGMSLKAGFAPLVLLAGHGARVVNNPHASALQCGACGGHAGDVNARLVAGLLNEPEVRDGLAARGIEIPGDTVFLAALHDTVTDEVALFEQDLPGGAIPASRLSRLRDALEHATQLARAERSGRLPRAEGGHRLFERARNWAETRPEWGLAGCAGFVAAPRKNSAGSDLGGRAFLHSYDWRTDKNHQVLELILTAPVVVASWISLQYYGSSVAPAAFGAGNKLLHNVTGGIGVVEGNGGVLRGGLPWQSVHDGTRFVHDPLRMTVAIDAPREAISLVLSRHPEVAALFDNGWLKLYALNAEGRLGWRYTGQGGWTGFGQPARRQAVAAE